MERYKLVIQYDGKLFSGWQVQPGKRTVQGELEKVLEFLLGEKVVLYASGRTDTGVSAYAQVAHFDTEKQIVEKKLLDSLNGLTDEDIAVVSVERVGTDFDARFSVKKKTYEYRFYVSKYTLPLLNKTALRINDYADIEKMQEACKFLVGTYDFESFVSRKSGKTDFVRTIFDAKITKKEDGIYVFEITGNGFLYNMVRIIFGTLVQVAYKKIEPKEIQNILSSKNRAFAGKTMPAYPLFMKSVVYETK